MKLLKFLLGLCLGVLILTIPFNQFQPSPLEPLQTLAVQLDGRKKPLDTVARETVAKIHGSTRYHPSVQTAPDDQEAKAESLEYLQTFLSLWFNNRDWNQEPFVLFSYRPLKETLGLDPDRKYFTFQELVTPTLATVVTTARQKQAAGLDLSRDEREALTIEERLALLMRTVGADSLPLVPHPTERRGKWLGLSDAEQYYTPAQATWLLSQYDQLKQIYRLQPRDLEALGQASAGLHEYLAALSPQVYPESARMQREVNFYHLQPFAKAWKLYAIAFLTLLLVLWIKPFEFYWGAIGIFIVGLAIQGYGFVDRMQIAGRPPVTNMYESVVWVGFGIAAIALLFELIHRAKYYLLAAAPLSVVCLLLADSLPAVLDSSIQPLVPVLRDNFWLSIHVPTITLGYASFALAMGLGHIILGHYVFASQASDRIRSLSNLNYRVLQVGVLLLTTGVILGGIWAHFSWGRFWGWDPKETWALIALMCYVVPLHGRLVGWLSNFGMGVISVVCFNAVLMAWYGVNFVLGTGLHSYGFSTGGSELIVTSLVAIDLLFVLLAATRYKGWLKSQPVAPRDQNASVSELPAQQS